MSDYDDYGSGGSCEECGEDLADDQPEWHRLCWSCWRSENDGGEDRRGRRPPPGTLEVTMTEALTALRREVHALENRVARLEELARIAGERRAA